MLPTAYVTNLQHRPFSCSDYCMVNLTKICRPKQKAAIRTLIWTFPKLSWRDSYFWKLVGEVVCVCVCLYLTSGGARARGPRPGEPIGL